MIENLTCAGCLHEPQIQEIAKLAASTREIVDVTAPDSIDSAINIVVKSDKAPASPVIDQQVAGVIHGTTTDNEKDLATGWLPGELSETGAEQAKKLGEQVAGTQFDVVFCSDLKRAVDSAELGFGGKYEIVQDARLRECDYGDMNGTSAAEFKDRMEDYVDSPFPNGESYKDVEKRLASLQMIFGNYKV